MKTIYSNLIFCSVMAMSLVSCKKESTSQNPSIPKVAFELKATNSSVLLNGTMSVQQNERIASGNIVWSAAAASANMIKFEAKKAGAELEYKSSIQQSIDLFSATPVLGSITIPNGSYDEVEFKAFLAPNGTLPALDLKGQFTNGTATTNIHLVVNEPIQIKGEKNNVIIQDTAYSAVSVLNLSVATQGISASALSNATVTNGEILITSSINSNLYNVIVNNLQNMHEETEVHHH
jgi:hypothetical protein